MEIFHLAALFPAPPVIPFAQAASAPPSPALTEQAAAGFVDFGGQATSPENRDTAPRPYPLPCPLLSLYLSLLLLSRGRKAERRALAQAPAASKSHRAIDGFRRARAPWSRREERPELLRRFPSFPGHFSARVEPAASSSPTTAAVSTPSPLNRWTAAIPRRQNSP